MRLKPAKRSDLLESLRAASRDQIRVEGWDLGALNAVVEYQPEDLTVTVEAGLSLGGMQSHLGRQGQWLPIDPPGAGELTIGALIAGDKSGPRRFGFGTIREHLIGIRVALPDGRLIRAGGRVVKNVAGYDLCKLFVGSRGTVGIIVEATFKLRPLPAREHFVRHDCETFEQAGRLGSQLLEGGLDPVVLDWHNLKPAQVGTGNLATVVAGFAGTASDVTWQLKQADRLGSWQPTDLAYDDDFRLAPPGVRQESILPCRLPETVCKLGGIPFVARAGNGLLYHRGEPVRAPTRPPMDLLCRIKETFDPKRILPEMPW
jgi:FAD/FMN-containing dehydrogenase